MLRDLLVIAGPALSPARPQLRTHEAQLAGRHAGDLLSLLERRNGFFAFGSALHVFPAGPVSGSRDLARWNAADLWRQAFGAADPGMLFFAENVLGEQFALGDEGVFRWDPETLESSRVGADLDEWAGAMMADPDGQAGRALAQRWEAAHGPLPAGWRIRPRFLLFAWREIDYSSLDSYAAADAVELMLACADLGRQLRRLPEGERVRIRVAE